jgi:hypothetical protein
MKKYIVSLLVFLFIAGCQNRPQDKPVLAKINNYEITQQEFEEEFKNSSFGRADTLDSRREFLNSLINRKLILQDAQKKGLDKDKAFLKMIEKFWEQSLLKLALDKKSKEIAGSAIVSDKSIEEAYNRMLKEGKTDKTYDQMYAQIKWDILKLKESKAMNDWINELHKNSDIKINYNLLNNTK